MSPWMWILDLLKKQGLSFVILGVAVWYFYGEVKRLNDKADLCQNSIIEMYQNVIISNTMAIDNMNWYLEELRKQKK